jgi:transcriptional regulator GlxA family with amidase domain
VRARAGSGRIDLVKAKSDIGREVAVAVIGYDGCSSWITAGIVEFFAIANLPPRARRGRPTRFSCAVVSTSRRTVRASHGVRFPSTAPRRRYDVVIAPPMWAPGRAELEPRLAALERLAPFVRRLAARSEITASACSGAVLLAHAGLLANRRATTCWWLADWFARRFPDVRLDARRLLVVDGACWTAAAGSAYLHLCLELVEHYAGAEIAAATARLALVEPRRGSQSPFLDRGALPRETDGPIAEIARWLDDRIDTPLSVADVARRASTTPRTLNRRFRAAFGVAPLAYLQARRIALAKQLLETRSDPLERIVERCGYTDVSSFRKLFAREVGMTPREYRLRFQR